MRPAGDSVRGSRPPGAQQLVVTKRYPASVIVPTRRSSCCMRVGFGCGRPSWPSTMLAGEVPPRCLLDAGAGVAAGDPGSTAQEPASQALFPSDDRCRPGRVAGTDHAGAHSRPGSRSSPVSRVRAPGHESLTGLTGDRTARAHMVRNDRQEPRLPSARATAQRRPRRFGPGRGAGHPRQVTVRRHRRPPPRARLRHDHVLRRPRSQATNRVMAERASFTNVRHGPTPADRDRGCRLWPPGRHR